jgi:hypothetical protein
MTKKNMAYVEAYKRATARHLYECYRNPSTKKRAAWHNCYDRMRSLDGYDIRILSHNVQFFTCAYRYKIGDDEYMNVETVRETIIILLKED